MSKKKSAEIATIEEAIFITDQLALLKGQVDRSPHDRGLRDSYIEFLEEMLDEREVAFRCAIGEIEIDENDIKSIMEALADMFGDTMKHLLKREGFNERL